MTAWTATHQHLALAGMNPSALVPDARALAAVYGGSAATFELPGHGFYGSAALAGAERVRFCAVSGVTLDTAIDPLAYYTVAVQPGDPDFFTVSLGGIPLVLAGDGIENPWIRENIIPKIDLLMTQWTSKVVANAKAYRAPWTTPPDWAPLLIAQLAAPTVAEWLRVAVARFDVEGLRRNYDAAMVQYTDLANGVPFDDGKGPIDADAIPNDAARATNGVLAGCTQPMAWVTGYL